MKKTILLFFLTVCYSITVHAQSFTITGIVFSSDSLRPIPFASISIKGKSLGCMANERGVFQILCSESDTIIIRAIGFEARTTNYFSVDSLLTQRVFLKRKIYSLGSVEIKGINTALQLKTAILNLKLEPEKEITIPGALQYKGPLDPNPPTIMNPISLIFDSDWAKRKRSKSWSKTHTLPSMK